MLYIIYIIIQQSYYFYFNPASRGNTAYTLTVIYHISICIQIYTSTFVLVCFNMDFHPNQLKYKL